MDSEKGREHVLYDQDQLPALLDELGKKLPLRYRDVEIASLSEEKEHGQRIVIAGQSVRVSSCLCVRVGEQLALGVLGYACARALDQHREIEMCLPLRSYDLERSFKLCCEVLRSMNPDLVDFFEHVFKAMVRMTVQINMVSQLVTPAPEGHVPSADDTIDALRYAMQTGQVLVRREFGDDELQRLLNIPIVERKRDSGEELQRHNLLRAALGYQLGKGHGTAPKGSN